MTTNDHDQKLRSHIRDGYAKIAETGAFVGESAGGVREQLSGGESTGCCGGGSCCGGLTMSVDDLAEQIGYTADQLAALPDGANMGLSCGNPGAIAALKPGETVVDLGSGGGFDVFLAGPKVGPQGRAIGVDMTHEMLSKARANTDHFVRTSGLSNVEFRLGEIENLPLADAEADVVISNCVINLSTDKRRVWEEIFRVLKPGGRVAVSDISLLRELPAEVKEIVESWVGCVAGAITVDEIRSILNQLGFTQIKLTPNPAYIEAMVGSGDPLYTRVQSALPEGKTPGDYLTSLSIEAVKPCGCGPGCC